MSRKKSYDRDEKNFTVRLSAFIVDKRKAFYLIYIGLLIFSIISSGWVKVDNILTDYLPENTETRQGLTVMEEEFTTFGTADIMIENISYEQGVKISEGMENIEGVKSVEYDDSEEHYKDVSGLFSVTFEGEEEDEISVKALNEIKEKYAGYDIYISSGVGDVMAEQLAGEMRTVMCIAAVIIVSVLLLTSHTYAEIPVLLMTFISSALINKGTNYLFGTISFVSNSVAVVLQLALAVDYAIILCHRYTEERELHEAREAVVAALSKSIPEILGSSLTTLSGLAAITFMQFRIGFDLGMVLIKSIIISLLCVFTLMPGLLMSFSSLIDRTHHRSFVPKINIWGKFVIKCRKISLPVFTAVIIGALFLSNMCPYVYGTSTLSTITKNDMQIAHAKITGTFGSENTMAMLVPAGNYEKEAGLIRELERMEEVDSVTGLANIEAKDGYMLAEYLSPRQFAELTDMDIDTARMLYSAYAAEEENYGKIISGIDSYDVPLLDMFEFLYQRVDEGYINLDDEAKNDIEDMHDALTDAKLQLLGDNYSRFVMELNLPEESGETFDFLDTLHETAEKYYEEGCIMVGDSTSDADLASSFKTDNILINILTIVFVILVLLFTFKSAGIPVLLILVIQGSIWINFAFPYILDENMFFMSYLIVSSIQMGANIDYAIVITNRYYSLKQKMPLKEAVVETLNQAFPTIITSGTMLASSGVLIGLLSSSEVVASIGVALGRGTIISIVLVMFLLPQLLYIGDRIIEKTSFTLKKPVTPQISSGYMRVDGHIKGQVSGIVDGEFKGTVKGTVNAVIDNRTSEKKEDEETEGKEAAEDEKQNENYIE
ncbi:MAG: MMPL family transporter [Bacillota bacterium]|nr:MMPL family transporter [Bacillota bacterium]